MPRFDVSNDDFSACIEHLRHSGVNVVMPDSTDRALVVDVLMLAHIAVPGWSRSHTADSVSVAFPALPAPLPTLLMLAGKAIAPLTQLGADGVSALARLSERPLISPSPRVIATRDVWAIFHETSHLQQSDAGGGIIHGLRYLVDREYAILAAEAPAYACDLFGSEDRDAALLELTEGLRPYGASDEQVLDARALLGAHLRVINGGMVPTVRALVDGVRFLHERGVSGLPRLPAIG